MAVCSNGHDSTWDDYCSECGVAIGGAAPAAGEVPPATLPASSSSSGSTCPNCAEPHGEADVFCENCGYDFLSGTLPDAGAAAASAMASTAGTDAAGEATTATIRFARTHMQRMVEDDELEYTGADDLAHDIDLAGVKVLVGRTSRSRGVYPEIDVREISGDPAVSSRHCMLMKAADGTWTVNDLGSTNGTYLGDADEALTPGVETPVPAGTPIYVGAWTSITLA